LCGVYLNTLHGGGQVSSVLTKVLTLILAWES
jgi:hypothetical protein